LIGGFSDFTAHQEEIICLGHSCLDPATVNAFIACVLDDLPALVAPEEVLTTLEIGPVLQRIEDLVYETGVMRMDRLAVMMMRIQLALLYGYVELEAIRPGNLIALLLSDFLPADQRMIFWKDITATGRADLKAFMADARLAAAIVGS
jgi:hypothetical protein